MKSFVVEDEGFNGVVEGSIKDENKTLPESMEFVMEWKKNGEKEREREREQRLVEEEEEE